MKRSLGQSRENCMELIVEEETIFKICVHVKWKFRMFWLNIKQINRNTYNEY